MAHSRKISTVLYLSSAMGGRGAVQSNSEKSFNTMQNIQETISTLDTSKYKKVKYNEEEWLYQENGDWLIENDDLLNGEIIKSDGSERKREGIDFSKEELVFL